MTPEDAGRKKRKPISATSHVIKLENTDKNSPKRAKLLGRDSFSRGRADIRTILRGTQIMPPTHPPRINVVFVKDDITHIVTSCSLVFNISPIRTVSFGPFSVKIHQIKRICSLEKMWARYEVSKLLDEVETDK